MQQLLFGAGESRHVIPFKTQLLKWIGNKQRFAHEIASYFPEKIRVYFEPFLGSGGVLGTLRPKNAVASDVFGPLIEIWQTLRNKPGALKHWYADRWHAMMAGEKVEEYERIKASYNTRPNAADLLFLCRTCYGGVIRFRQSDGYISTPCGVHRPITPDAFRQRVDEWRKRTGGTRFEALDFEEALSTVKKGDLVYCDPPYRHSQSILYGSQSFDLVRLFEAIARCKARGARVALSIDGTKKSGSQVCNLSIPQGLFEREVFVNCGRSMLRRFQMGGGSLETEVVADRLLLTY